MKYRPYPAYKDSGVEWLGAVPEGWAVLPLKRLAQTQLSNVDKHAVDGEQAVKLCNYVDVYKNDRITAGMEFMLATASDEQIKRLSIRHGDVLITKDSETPNDIGVPALVSEDMAGVVCGYHLALLRPRSGVCTGGYLARLLTSSYVRANFATSAVGMTRYGLGKYDIENVPLPTPSVTEQTAIATFLDRETVKLDTLITKQEELIEFLQEKRQAIISHAVTKGLNPDAPMKGSGVAWLGEVPEHWEILQSRRLFSERKERIRPEDEQLTASQKYGVIPQKLFTELEGQKVMQVLTNSEILKHVEPGDFVISMRSFQGGIEWCGHRGCVSSAYVPLIPGDKIASGYFRYLFKSTTYIQALQSTSNLVRDGQALRFANFVQVPLPMFPKAEQEAIAEFLDAEISKIDALEEKSRRSIELMREHRTALISAAVTGKIDVRKAA